MSLNRPLIVLIVMALAAPVAAAGSAPSLVFLADAESGPIGDGILSQEWPDSNESKARPVLVDLAGPTAVFVDMEDPPGTHLRGHVFVGVWPDAAIAKDARLKAVLMLDGASIAEAFVPVNVDPSTAPDPMSLLPPDPTDPEGAVYHALAQVVPLILQPPTLIDLGLVDMEIPEGGRLSIGFGLVGIDASPPLGAALVLKYDGILTPSFAYLPWWSADPAAVSPQIKEAQLQAPVPAPSPSPSEPPAPASSPGEDSPGVGVLAFVAALGVALVLRRR